jgi:hypothetical protein
MTPENPTVSRQDPKWKEKAEVAVTGRYAFAVTDARPETAGEVCDLIRLVGDPKLYDVVFNDPSRIVEAHVKKPAIAV